MSTSTKETAVNCTCPNCGTKFTLSDLEVHLGKCPRTKNSEFPKYLVVTSIPHLGRGKERKFITMGEAGQLFDSGMMQVEIRRYVLEAGFSVRLISEAELALISQIADAYSDSK